MLKSDIFSNKIYLSNIIRNMLVSGCGFFVVWILYIFFEEYEMQEDIFISGFLIFIIFAGLFFYNSILENSLFLLLNRKRLLPFLLTNSSLVVVIFFNVVYLGNEVSSEIALLLLIFVLLQVVGFLYQRNRENLSIKKRKKPESVIFQRPDC